MDHLAVFEGGRFHVPSAAKAVAIALHKDDRSLDAGVAESLLRAALATHGYPPQEERIGPTVMFMVFADWIDSLGRKLGEAVSEEGFALDWTGRYPHLAELGAFIAQTCVQIMVSCSAQFEAENGYRMADVLTRMMEQGISPEEAASQLSQERSPPTRH